MVQLEATVQYLVAMILPVAGTDRMLPASIQVGFLSSMIHFHLQCGAAQSVVTVF